MMQRRTTSIALLRLGLMVVMASICVVTADLSASKDHGSARTSSLRSRREALEEDPCTGTWSTGNNGDTTGCDGDAADPSEHNDDLQCDLHDNDNTGALKPTTFEYWYGVETPLNTTDSFMPDMEDQIFAYASERMSWCVGNRRRMITLDTPEVRQARQLGIIGVRPTPDDVDTNVTCAYDLVNASNNCIVVQGFMTIIARENDNLNYTIFTLQQAFNLSMTTDHLLAFGYPGVVKVTYLGDSDPSIVPLSTARGIAPVPEDDDDDGFVGIIAVSIFALLLLLLGMSGSKDRTVVTESTTTTTTTTAAAAGGGVGAVAADGSFHAGKYHYTRDGERYLDNNCEKCQETILSLQGDRGLAAIDEGAEFDEMMLVTANSKDLGARHHGMDVHHCISCNCEECLLQKNQIGFIRVNGSRRTHAPGIMSVDDEAEI